MLRTPLCSLLGIDVPIIQAPIGGASCPELVAAVSNCGGLGMLSATWRSPTELQTLLQETCRLTQRPFGINLVLEEDVSDKLHICLDAGVKIVSLFWGTPHQYIETSHDAGALVMHTIGNVAEAKEAVAAGADVIVAQGWEAGGHVRGVISTLTLVPLVVDAVAPIPVIAAGGIADGRGIAAALALGASATWLGTRFVASAESLAHLVYKQHLIDASPEDTIYSTLFDIGWPNAPHRALRNSTFDLWEKTGCLPHGQRPNEDEIIAQRADGTPIKRYSMSAPLETMQGNIEGLAQYAGQSVGLIKDICSVSDIMQQLTRETEMVFEQWNWRP